ncbi:pantoate--beta-alanine ligase [Vineibacter terrae]|uniref:pantoate--beta-alanine ligase n=1 Tax=Vineibacter terrae TaxID=2586908 RepID=UPI002E3469F2|nr:pantoate--beta-alanine ligase [Vineibacter terrae]HEX2891902.1 pantoate--beta-alanine ligase [Vineibacter terrae]
MDVIATVAGFREARARYPRLGVVPTMGFLHEGHLSLVRQAKQECGAAAATIFVNPTQFGPREDFSTYPRDMERDLALLRDLGTDLVFAPDVAEMYPPGYAIGVEVGGVTDVLEGAVRPGHFLGVATVVCKLFNITQPTRAYFGQKDAQQTVVIRKMVRDLDMPLEVVVCPTVREADGLAMSSRNTYLAPAERQAATILYRALRAAQARHAAGERTAEALRHVLRTTLAGEPAAATEYVSVADRETLRELETVPPQGALLSLAVRIGRTRLIDNIIVGG